MTRIAKDERIVVRMDSELRAWITAEAQSLGVDDAAWVRMLLIERRRGVSRPPADDQPLQPHVSELDASAYQDEQQDEGDTAADINSLVASRVEQAVRSGTTARPQAQQQYEDPMPPVRGLSAPQSRIQRNGLTIERRRFGH